MNKAGVKWGWGGSHTHTKFNVLYPPLVGGHSSAYICKLGSGKEDWGTVLEFVIGSHVESCGEQADSEAIKVKTERLLYSWMGSFQT